MTAHGARKLPYFQKRARFGDDEDRNFMKQFYSSTYKYPKNQPEKKAKLVVEHSPQPEQLVLEEPEEDAMVEEEDREQCLSIARAADLPPAVG